MNQRLIIAAAAVVLLGGIAWAVLTHVKKEDGGLSPTPGSSAPVNQLLEDAAKYEAANDKVHLKETYEKIVTDYPDYDKVAQVQDKLGDLNMTIITSAIATPRTVAHEIVAGDSLGKLAKQYNTTKELIKKRNGLKSDVIRVGEKLIIWNAPFSVVVNKSQNILTLKTGDEVVKIFHVSTGANNITPVGTFKIANKIINPVWFKPGGAPVPPESPENVLGTRWMGFEEPNSHYGIHGTTEPDKIGQQVTAGCVRMRNEEVEQLFDLLPVGTQVTIQD